MVLSGKTSRNASLVNQTNTSGGVKKAGTASTVGVPSSVSAIYVKRFGCQSSCPFIISKTVTCSRIGVPAGIISCR
jgi:hypothetical protein